MKFRNIAITTAGAMLAVCGVWAQNTPPEKGFAPREEEYEKRMVPVLYYTEGVRLAALDSLDQAYEMLTKATRLDSLYAPACFELAGVRARKGEIMTALESSKRAYDLDPGNVWYASKLAQLNVTLGFYDQAIGLYESLIANAKSFDPDNYQMLALLYNQQERVDEALAVIDSADVRMGASPEFTALKRNILINADRVADAIRVTEEFVAKEPFDEENRLELAGLYDYTGQDSLKMQMIKEVLEIDPNNLSALTALAEHYNKKGNAAMFFATVKQLFLIDEVPLAYKTEYFTNLTNNLSVYRANYANISDLALLLVTRYPGHDEVLELYAKHLVASGEVDAAGDLMKTRLALGGETLSTYMWIIEIEAYRQRADSVARYSAMALNKFPKESDLYLLLSGAQQSMNKNSEAIKTLEKGLKIAGDAKQRSTMYGSIGTVWYAEGNRNKTFKYYDRALAENPENAFVLNNYAYFLAEENRKLDFALSMARKATQLEENSSTNLDTYAWVLYRMGAYAEAKKVMQKALPLDRDGSHTLLFHYGDILHALGENLMAEVYWKRALEAGEDPDIIEKRLQLLQK